MARKPTSKPTAASNAAAAGQAAAKRQAAARARAEKKRQEVQARFDAAKAEFEAAKAAFQYPGSTPDESAAQAEAGAGVDASGVKDGGASADDVKSSAAPDDEVEYLGRADPRERFFAQGRTANGTNVDTTTFDSLANPVAQQAAAMMTEDYRAFMQGSEQLILAATGQAMKELLVDQKKGAEILAVLAVYQAAITAVGAEVALVAAFTKSEFSSS
jgi:hypothetical protein